MALYLPPASSRTSTLISQSSSFGAKMTRALLRKQCTVRRSTTAVSQSTSTIHLGKPNSTLLHLHLFLQDCIPDSVQALPAASGDLLVGENKSDSRPPYSHFPSTPLHRHERTCRIHAHRRRMVAHHCLHITTARSCMVPANRSNSHPHLDQARLGPAISSSRATYSAKTPISTLIQTRSSPTFGALAR